MEKQLFLLQLMTRHFYRLKIMTQKIFPQNIQTIPPKQIGDEVESHKCFQKPMIHSNFLQITSDAVNMTQ